MSKLKVLVSVFVLLIEQIFTSDLCLGPEQIKSFELTSACINDSQSISFSTKGDCSIGLVSVPCINIDECLLKGENWTVNFNFDTQSLSCARCNHSQILKKDSSYMFHQCRSCLDKQCIECGLDMLVSKIDKCKECDSSNLQLINNEYCIDPEECGLNHVVFQTQQSVYIYKQKICLMTQKSKDLIAELNSSLKKQRKVTSCEDGYFPVPGPSGIECSSCPNGRYSNSGTRKKSFLCDNCKMNEISISELDLITNSHFLTNECKTIDAVLKTVTDKNCTYNVDDRFDEKYTIDGFKLQPISTNTEGLISGIFLPNFISLSIEYKFYIVSYIDAYFDYHLEISQDSSNDELTATLNDIPLELNKQSKFIFEYSSLNQYVLKINYKRYNSNEIKNKVTIRKIFIKGAVTGPKPKCFACPDGYIPNVLDQTQLRNNCIKCKPGTIPNDFFNQCVPCIEIGGACKPCPNFTSINESKDSCALNLNLVVKKRQLLISLKGLVNMQELMCNNSDELCYGNNNNFFGPIVSEEQFFFLSLTDSSYINVKDFTYYTKSGNSRGHVFALMLDYDINSKVKRLVNIGANIQSVKILPYLDIKDLVLDKVISSNLTGVTIKYAEGEKCRNDPSMSYSTVIILICDPNTFNSSPKFIKFDDKECTFYLAWKTRHVCPLCTSKKLINTGNIVTSNCQVGSLSYMFSHSNYCVLGKFEKGKTIDETMEKLLVDRVNPHAPAPKEANESNYLILHDQIFSNPDIRPFFEKYILNSNFQITQAEELSADKQYHNLNITSILAYDQPVTIKCIDEKQTSSSSSWKTLLKSTIIPIVAYILTWFLCIYVYKKYKEMKNKLTVLQLTSKIELSNHPNKRKARKAQQSLSNECETADNHFDEGCVKEEETISEEDVNRANNGKIIVF